MERLTVRFDCGHEAAWGDSPFEPGPDLPWVGRVAFCAECGQDAEIVAVTPERADVATVTLSEHEPRQSGNYAGGFQAGDQATIFYDAKTGEWGYVLHGVSADGNVYESDDVEGFASRADAEAAARATVSA